MRKIMGLIGAITALFSTSSSAQKSSVHVEFLNSRDNSQIGIVDLPLDKLPDTFAISTTLDIAKKKWSVERANPETKSEFAKSGHLRVYLAPIAMVPPGDILYSLPTISDEIGAIEGTAPPDSSIFQIHEDDWRQIELIDQHYGEQIESEFVDIRKIHEGRKPGGGFKTLHVRKTISRPLKSTSIKLEDLEKAFPPKRSYKAVGIIKSPGVFQKSFAWEIEEGAVLWGAISQRGDVEVLCLSVVPAKEISPDFFKALEQFCSTYKLYLVNWCRAAKGATDSEIAILLKH